MRLEGHRERRELLSDPGRKCLCPDRVVGGGFEEDGPGWLRTETMRRGGVLGGGAWETHRSSWWLNQMVWKKTGEKSLKVAC